MKNKEALSENVTTISMLIGIISLLIMIFGDDSTTFYGINLAVFFCCLILFITFGAINNSEKNKKMSRQAEQTKEREIVLADNLTTFLPTAEKRYRDIAKEIGMSNNYCKTVNNKKIWIFNDSLYLMVEWNEFKRIIKNRIRQYESGTLTKMMTNAEDYPFKYTCISIKNIKYFTKEGELHYTTEVTGGGGGGSSVKGAVVGGLIAGGAGAVVGSRNKMNEIRSNTVAHDTRKTVLKYFENGKLKSMEFGLEYYNAFEELMPDKEYNIVVNNSSNKPNTEKEEVNIKVRLKKLNELKDEGLITEDEYRLKKQELLSGI